MFIYSYTPHMSQSHVRRLGTTINGQLVWEVIPCPQKHLSWWGNGLRNNQAAGLLAAWTRHSWSVSEESTSLHKKSNGSVWGLSYCWWKKSWTMERILYLFEHVHRCIYYLHIYIVQPCNSWEKLCIHSAGYSDFFHQTETPTLHAIVKVKQPAKWHRGWAVIWFGDKGGLRWSFGQAFGGSQTFVRSTQSSWWTRRCADDGQTSCNASQDSNYGRCMECSVWLCCHVGVTPNQWMNESYDSELWGGIL